MGRNLIAFLLMPAAWHVSTTSVTFLYDSGASSMTNFGDATRIAIPMSRILFNTSVYSSLRRDLALDNARPLKKKIERIKKRKIQHFVIDISVKHLQHRDRLSQRFQSFQFQCRLTHNCKCPSFHPPTPVAQSTDNQLG